MKGIILLADYFEDVEAICTIDMLRRAYIQIDLISITGKKNLITQSQINIVSDELVENINLDEYEFIILPGGKAVYKTHLESVITKNVIEHFYNNGKLIGAICAAPMLLSKYLVNKKFTCFPSCEEKIDGIYTKNKVEVVNNIITSKAAGTVFDFSYELIKYLKNEEIAKKVLSNVYYK